MLLRPREIVNLSQQSIPAKNLVFTQPSQPAKKVLSKDLAMAGVIGASVARSQTKARNRRFKHKSHIIKLDLQKQKETSKEFNPYKDSDSKPTQVGRTTEQTEPVTNHSSVKVNNLSMDSSLQIETLKQELRLLQSIESTKLRGGISKMGGFRRPLTSSLYQIRRGSMQIPTWLQTNQQNADIIQADQSTTPHQQQIPLLPSTSEVGVSATFIDSVSNADESFDFQVAMIISK